MNNPELQKDLFKLEKKEQLALLATLKKMHKMIWDEVFRRRFEMENYTFERM